jgi:hydrogenase expression/formation protein HypC
MCLAVPGKIREILNSEPLKRTGLVDFGGTTKEINLSLVPDARIGDYVIVHAGLALNIINEDEAAQTLKMLDEISENTDFEEKSS